MYSIQINGKVENLPNKEDLVKMRKADIIEDVLGSFDTLVGEITNLRNDNNSLLRQLTTAEESYNTSMNIREDLRKSIDAKSLKIYALERSRAFWISAIVFCDIAFVAVLIWLKLG